MNNQLASDIQEICAANDNDRTRMMDIVREVQKRFGCVSGEAMTAIAERVGAHRVEVQSMASFYAFLSSRPQGKVVIRVCEDIIDRFKGESAVSKAFRHALRIDFGETTPDGVFTLEHTPCIGMCDQAPAVLVNDTVFTEMNACRAKELVDKLKKNPDPAAHVENYGDGNNAHERVRAMVRNNLRKRGQVLFEGYKPDEGLKKALALTPQEVIRDVKTARLRGRGGAGFPTGMKWEFTRGATAKKRFVICNADEGEPGTFKDRVLLTETADMLFEGMTIAGYAIGADTGIVYLRAEYAYLRAFLEDVLKRRRDQGLLGKSVCGSEGFDFDIRIQMGAGAYICGEETSLISSCEGLRGDPKTRPPFPAQKGFLGLPTTVNNVETFCCVSRILDEGAGWFAQIGSEGSPGTKLLSVSGDCASPGVYEVPFGTRLKDFLELCGAKDAQAVQIGGPSGQLVGADQFQRTICYDDLATGGSVMVFGAERDLLDVVRYWMEFFIEESCGFCTPCRVGNVLLKERLERIMNGKGEPSDMDYMKRLAHTVKTTSRCGLGQTSPNPILTSLEHFPDLYKQRVHESEEGFQAAFDLKAALGDAEALAGRQSIHAE